MSGLSPSEAASWSNYGNSLGAESFETAFAEGKKLNLEEARNTARLNA